MRQSDDFLNPRWQPLEDEYQHLSFADWNGPKPKPEDYMPDWAEAERTHYQMYETTTEETPLSPVMDSPEALARWLTDTNASAFGNLTTDYNTWLQICEGHSRSIAVELKG